MKKRIQDQKGTQLRMKSKVFSTRWRRERVIKYMSHGASRAGSDVWRALYEAKIGKRTVVATLEGYQHVEHRRYGTKGWDL